MLFSVTQAELSVLPERHYLPSMISLFSGNFSLPVLVVTPFFLDRYQQAVMNDG